MIKRLIISFPGVAPMAASFGAGLCLLLFIDDLATPRAKARLIDLARQGGARPVNLSRLPGQALRLALVDPAGIWSGGAPHIEVALEGGGSSACKPYPLANLILMMHYFRWIFLLSRINGDAPPASEI